MMRLGSRPTGLGADVEDLMLDRVLPIVLAQAAERHETRHVLDAFRQYLRRVLQLLRRLIEAGGPMS
jgi:hypothetical protein